MTKRQWLTQTNSFQKWAYAELRNAGIDNIQFTGNWVNVDGEALMTYDGVTDYIQSR